MPRIVHVFSVADIGGAEAVSLNIVRFREDPGVEHAAAVLSDESGPLEQALVSLGIPVRRVPRGRMRHPLSLLRAVRELRRAIRQLEPDVLLANSAQAFLYARLAALRLGVPVAVYYMAVPEKSLWRNGMLDILMALGRPAITFTASKTIGRLVSGWGVRTDVVPVYHGTPARQPTPDGLRAVQNELAQLGIGDDDPVILLSGRLQPWKGQHILIEALPEVLRVHPRAHAILLGGALFGMDLDYPDRLRADVERLSLKERVHILGHRPDVRNWIERANVIVHASVSPDAFPNVCIEALAARRPLITNTSAGTREIVSDGRGALVTSPGNPTELARAINALLSDRAEAAAMAERGFECYEAYATPSHMVRPIEAAVSRLAGESPRSLAASGGAAAARRT